jgi:hypothetical protein
MPLVQQGTPVVGYLSLTNGAPGPVAIAFTYADGTNRAYAFIAAERLYVTNVSMSSNDTAQALITVDTGGATPTKLASQYLSNTQPPGVVSYWAGVIKCEFGIAPRGTATAVTAAKTVEIVVNGYVART